jgi:hypothetical protein
MLTMAYGTFGAAGFFIYRGCKKNAQYLKSLDDEDKAGS